MEITSYLLGKKSGGIQPTGEISITENGKTNVSGYATADVNVQPTLQNKSVSITSNGSTSVSADENYDGLDTVSITTNVQPNLETKSITITENTTTTITPTTGKDGLSSVEVITNVSSGGSYNATMDLSKLTNNSYLINTITEVPTINAGSLGLTSLNNLFSGCYASSFSLTNTSNVTSFNGTFYNCKNMTTAPNLDTSSATSMKQMFYGCSNLTTIPLYDLSSVTDTSYMFSDCPLFTTLPNIDTSSVTNMQNMFSGCRSLETAPNIDTSSVTNLANMFNGCYNLKNLPLYDTSNVTDMWLMVSNNGDANLTDTSLDNLLQMCINTSPNYIRPKKLTDLSWSFTYRTSEIEALPHYQDFIDAGWTIS